MSDQEQPDAAARAAIVEALRPLERDGIAHLQARGLIVTATAQPSR